MDWIEAVVYTSRKGIDTISSLIIDNDITGMTICDDEEMKEFLEENPFNWDYVDEKLLNKENEEPHIIFYLPRNQKGVEKLENIKLEISNLKNKDMDNKLGRLMVECKNVSEDSWKDNWKEYYKPFKIGENVIIKPIWEEYDKKDGEIVFTINPGSLFGTGLHQTTKLCIIALEKYINENSKFLDLGCGTGILGLISLLLGANKGSLVDMEPNVEEVVTENMENNNIDGDKVKIFQGNVLKDSKLLNSLKEDNYNIIIANIVADVIIELAQFSYDNLEKDGIFISSGIIIERQLDVKNALEKVGFEILEIQNMDNWISFIAKK